MTLTDNHPSAVDPSPEEGPPAPAVPVRVVFLAIVAAMGLLVSLQQLVPSTGLGITVLGAALLLTVINWYLCYSTRAPRLEPFQRFGMALITPLSAIAVLETIALLEHLGSNAWSAAAVIGLVNVLPAAANLSDTPAHALRKRSGTVPFALYAGLVLLALLGSVVVAISMNTARTHATPTAAFAIFWLGMAIGVLPALMFALRTRSPSVGFVCVLLALAIYAPVLLHSSGQIYNFDEFAHQGETKTMLRTGRLFLPDSVLPIGPHYPGFETLNAALVRLSGLSVSTVGVLVVALCRISALLGIAYLARLVSPNRPAAPAVAAAAYAVSPQFIYFDSLYSYETFALPLMIWLFVAVIEHSRGRSEFPWSALALTLGAAGVITHHLSTYLAVGILLILSGAMAANLRWQPIRSLRNRRDEDELGNGKASSLLRVAILLAAAAIVWAFVNEANVVRYLSTFPRSAFTALDNYLHGKGSFRSFLSGHKSALSTSAGFNEQASSTRGLFQGTLLPFYERACSIGAQFVLLGIFLLSSRRLALQGSRLGLGWAAVAFCYFLSLPLTLVGLASSGAHRTWAFSFIGVAICVSSMAKSSGGGQLSPSGHRKTRALAWGLVGLRGGTSVLIAVSAAVVAVGNYASSVNLYNRFPGPYVLGADGRDMTSDVKRSATWFAENVGYGEPVVSTRRTFAVFGSYADAQTVGFPGWDLFFPIAAPSALVHQSLVAAGAGYVVVDRRLDSAVPTQSYFSVYEPDPPSIPLPAASITKFDSVPWLTKIHTDGNVSIYKIAS